MHVDSWRDRIFSTVSAWVAVVLTVAVAAGPARAQLVNPGFDSGPLGPVGNFGTVVGPPAQYGFWGAEDADIVNGTSCGTGPRSNPYMLQLNPGGGSYSQAWQAVDVSSGPPSVVSLRAWGNTCLDGQGVTIGVDLRTFNDANGWPNHTLLATNGVALDANPGTWQQAALNCIAIPPDTHWILAQVYMANATSGGLPSYIDDVELVFGQCSIAVEKTTWSAVKQILSR
jgi:hypothetical protein